MKPRSPSRPTPDARGAAARRTPWYVAAFGRDYLERYASRSEAAAQREVAFLIALLDLPAASRVLDLCCGGGRHSRALAHAGFRVMGLDLSRELLQFARQKVLALGAPNPRSADPPRVGAGPRPALTLGAPCLARADGRALPLRDAVFDAVLNLFTSFGYFETEEEDLRMLGEAARVLKPGGRFVLDFFNAGPTLRALVPRTEKRVAGARVVEERRYDAARQRLEKTISIGAAAGAGPDREFLESVRTYTPDDLSALLRRAGLAEVQRFGDLHGAAFSADDSPRCVCVARKGPA